MSAALIEMPFGRQTRVRQKNMYYFGCTLAQPGKYDLRVRSLLCGLLSNYFEQSCLLLVYKVTK